MTREATERKLKIAKRLLAIEDAKDDMRAFMRIMMPDPRDPDDVDLSRHGNG